jgi:hypothetical protein
VVKRSSKKQAWTAEEAAQAVGLSPASVRRLARTMGLGTKHGERAWVFKPIDLVRLRGRPRVGKYDRRET